MYGFVRYLGPHNGGCTEQNKGEYAALLKVFLASPSLRWFMDTYLTQSNIRDLLGENSPEITQLKKQWYCLRLTGCAQDNSHFPVLVWIKKQRFWKEERLEDGLFLTMKDSMLTAPVLVNNAEDTLRGPWQRQRKPPGIDLYCTKTNGCAFVSKHKKTMEDHVKKCRPKVTQLVCKTQGCKFVTPYKSALTIHKKKCDQLGAQSEIVAGFDDDPGWGLWVFTHGLQDDVHHEKTEFGAPTHSREAESSGQGRKQVGSRRRGLDRGDRWQDDEPHEKTEYGAPTHTRG